MSLFSSVRQKQQPVNMHVSFLSCLGHIQKLFVSLCVCFVCFQDFLSSIVVFSCAPQQPDVPSTPSCVSIVIPASFLVFLPLITLTCASPPAPPPLVSAVRSCSLYRAQNFLHCRLVAFVHTAVYNTLQNFQNLSPIVHRAAHTFVWWYFSYLMLMM